jgi:hypothetical protein
MKESSSKKIKMNKSLRIKLFPKTLNDTKYHRIYHDHRSWMRTDLLILDQLIKNNLENKDFINTKVFHILSHIDLLKLAYDNINKDRFNSLSLQ